MAERDELARWRMFRRSGYRFADKNMRHARIAGACPDSEGTGHALGDARRHGPPRRRSEKRTLPCCWIGPALSSPLPQASEFEMRPLLAHCHLGLAKPCRRTGRREQAQEHLATATTIYREMGMTYWLERAEAEKG